MKSLQNSEAPNITQVHARLCNFLSFPQEKASYPLFIFIYKTFYFLISLSLLYHPLQVTNS